MDAAGAVNYNVQGEGFSPTGSVTRRSSTSKGGDEFGPKATAASDVGLAHIARIATLCNDAHLQMKKGTWSVMGGATEGALKVLAEKLGTSDSQYNAHTGSLS